jgi:Ni/Co efflux regulator RcnB
LTGNLFTASNVKFWSKEMSMKRILALAAAACLLAVTPALAEHHDHGGGGGGNHGGGGGSHSGGGGGSHVSHSSSTHSFSSGGGGSHTTRTVHTSHVNVIRGGHESSRTVTHVNTTRTVHGRSFSNHRTVVNVRSFRRNFTAPHRYHWGAYNRPSGWYAHRWVYGERLPHGWYGHDYWIGNYVSFGLIAPPDGYVWVRSGDDALLVDEDSGEVLQVEYGVFY